MLPLPLKSRLITTMMFVGPGICNTHNWVQCSINASTAVGVDCRRASHGGNQKYPLCWYYLCRSKYTLVLKRTAMQEVMQRQPLMSLQVLCALKSRKQPTIYHIPPLHRLSVNLMLQVQHRSNHIQSPTPHELSL